MDVVVVGFQQSNKSHHWNVLYHYVLYIGHKSFSLDRKSFTPSPPVFLVPILNAGLAGWLVLVTEGRRLWKGIKYIEPGDHCSVNCLIYCHYCSATGSLPV